MANNATSSQPEELRIHLFGDFRVWVGDQEIDSHYWRFRKARNLFRLLALATDHRMHKEQLMDTLWPDSSPKAAANNLHQTLYKIRGILESHGANPQVYLQFRNEFVSLCPNSTVWVDAKAFETAAKQARQKCDPGSYQAALALYAGDLLPEDHFEDWVRDRREGLRQEQIRLLFELAGLFEAEGKYPPAIETYQKIIASDPLQEEAYAGLMRALTLTGQRTQALGQYQALVAVLDRELEAEPDPQTTLLYQDIQSGRFPPAGIPSPPETPPAPHHQLPSPLSTFIGREDDIRQVKQLLTRSRLVTLTGSGGVGKTRLAIRVAEEVLTDYPEGVWLVALDSLSRAEQVPYAVADAFGVREREAGTLLENLEESLRTKQLLLVLDNCEHLVEICANLASTLLPACPNLHLLATSREALGIKGEILYQVPLLSCPDTHNPPPLAAVAQCEAVQLFVERAQAVLPSFKLTADNAASIVQICQRLDGIPLALELAAARVNLLNVEQIAARLDDLFRLLTRGNRTDQPRQQTLQDSIDWSYDLLSQAEQTLFRRLSVFNGGWNLAAAEQVCADSLLQPGDILDLLGQLIDKSLVMVDSETGKAARYRLLVTIRQYALNKITDEEEWDSLRDRHLDYFLQLAETSEPRLETGEQAACMNQLKTEQENLRGALEWSLGEKGPRAAEGLRLASALLEYWQFNGLGSEAYDWLQKGLAYTDRDETCSIPLLAKALYAFGMISSDLVTDEALQILEESEKLFRQCKDRAGLSRVLLALGLEYWYHIQQHREKTLPLLQEAVALARQSEDFTSLARALDWRGGFTVDKDIAAAKADAEESLALFNEMGNHWGAIGTLFTLGTLSRQQGDYEAANAYAEEYLRVARQDQHKMHIANATNLSGRIAYFMNNFKQMEASFKESMTMGRECGHKRWVVYSLRMLGIAVKRQAEYRRSAAYLWESLRLAENLGDIHGDLLTLGLMAGLAARNDQPERAARLLGADAALLATMGMIADALEQSELDRDTAFLRSQLDEKRFEAAWSEGRQMTMEQARAEALAIGAELS